MKPTAVLVFLCYIVLIKSSFKDTSKRKLCKLYVLADCAVSVQLSEQMFFGKILSNLTVCDEYKDKDDFIRIEEIQANGTQNDIFDVFYKLYLNLTRVILT